MFFEEAQTAIREMARVLRPSGRLVVSVWSAFPDNEGYQALTELLGRTCGPKAAAELKAPFWMGEPELLRRCFADASLKDVTIERVEGESRFPSLQDWLHTNVRGWTLGVIVSDEAYARLVDEAKTGLARFVQADGQVVLKSVAHIVTA